MKYSDVIKYRKKAIAMLKKAKIALTPEEKNNIEIVDLGLGDFEKIGLAIITYINNERYCAKELILLPYQICPEHKHPPISPSNPGKTETFRCRKGRVVLYIEGEPSEPEFPLPAKYEKFLTVRKKIILLPGEQYTIPFNTLHWFQAGKEGAIVSEFSSQSIDEKDIFTDPNIKRIPVIEK